MATSSWRRYVNELIAGEVSALTRYSDRLVHFRPRPADSPYLIDAVVCGAKTTAASPDDIREAPDAILLNGTFNYEHDIQGLLQALKTRLTRASRLVVVMYNPYFRLLYQLATALGIRQAEVPTTFITRADLENLAALSGFQVVRIRPVAYSPWRLLGIGSLLNRLLPAVPGLRWLALASVVTLRPVVAAAGKPSLSIVIPARNERGNVEAALRRLPDLGTDVEVIFVEGHSTDGTWEEITRVAAIYARPGLTIKALQQTGKGKADAARIGFAHATRDLVTILDADLTMPPERIGRFYDAYCAGLADFVNGTRLVYPMARDAMRFANRLGNVFFAKALSFVLDERLGDSLCGTKLVSRRDYERFTRWRSDFGDFDPFGDFELLFPATVLALGIVDVPVRYEARTYGATNISRFRDGWVLARMTLLGFWRIKCGARPSRGML